jgi:hypothetical protein
VGVGQISGDQNMRSKLFGSQDRKYSKKVQEIKTIILVSFSGDRIDQKVNA